MILRKSSGRFVMSVWIAGGGSMVYVQVGFEICFFQAEEGIRDVVQSRGLGEVNKRQGFSFAYIKTSAEASHKTHVCIALKQWDNSQNYRLVYNL